MNRTYDIVIAGGGVIGASCAYQLSRRGNLRIAVVDDKGSCRDKGKLGHTRCN